MTNRIIELGPVDFHTPMAKHVKAVQTDRATNLKQWVARRDEQVKVRAAESDIKFAEGLKEFSGSLATFVSTVRKMQQEEETDAANQKTKDRQELLNRRNNLQYINSQNDDQVKVWSTDGGDYNEKSIELGLKDAAEKYKKENKVAKLEGAEYEKFINQTFYHPDQSQLRDYYLSLSPRQQLINTELVAIEVAGGLTKQAHGVYLQNNPEEQRRWEKLTERDQQVAFNNWQLDQLEPYQNSQGLLADTVLNELGRQSSTAKNVRQAGSISNSLTAKTQLFKERAAAYSQVDNQTIGQFVLQEAQINASNYTDIARADGTTYTALQQSLDHYLGSINELSQNTDGNFLNVPNLLQQPVDHPAGKTFGEAIGRERRQSLERNWTAGANLRVNLANAQRDQNLLLALDARRNGGSAADAEAAALDFLNKGGKETDANYVALINLKNANPGLITVEKELGEKALSSGRVRTIENALQNTTNPTIQQPIKANLDELKKLRKIHGFGDNNSDAYAQTLLKDKTSITIIPGEKLSGSPAQAITLISHTRDAVISQVLTEAIENNTPLWDTSLAEQVNDRTNQKLTLLGFGLIQDKGQITGPLAFTAEGEFPVLEIEKAAKQEGERGSTKETTIAELGNIKRLVKQGTPLKAILQTSESVLNEAELVAFWTRNENWEDDGSVKRDTFRWPPDILLKAEILGIPASELIQQQTEALIAKKSEGSTPDQKALREFYNLQEYLTGDNARTLPTVDRTVYQSITRLIPNSKNPLTPTLKAKLNSMGLRGLTNNDWKSILETEKFFQPEADKRDAADTKAKSSKMSSLGSNYKLDERVLSLRAQYPDASDAEIKQMLLKNPNK